MYIDRFICTIRCSNNSSVPALASTHLVWWELASTRPARTAPTEVWATFPQLRSVRLQPPSLRHPLRLSGIHLEGLSIVPRNTGHLQSWFRLRFHPTTPLTILNSNCPNNNSSSSSHSSESNSTELFLTLILRFRWFIRFSIFTASTPCPGCRRQAWGQLPAKARAWMALPIRCQIGTWKQILYYI